MIVMFLANGFEEVEALCPLDLMRRAGLDVLTVGIGGKEIVGSHGISVAADIADCDYDASVTPELVFLPGGMPGTLNLGSSPLVLETIRKVNQNGGRIAAICAAPSILGDMGLLAGKEAICYPGFEDRLQGAVISDKRVVSDGNILTAAGMGVALDFGLLLVEVLCGKDKAQSLRHAVIAD